MLDWVPTPIRERLRLVKHRFIRWLARLGYVESLPVELERQFTELGISTVVDVGANRGLYGRMIRSMGYTGRIISFEPVAALFDALAQVARADGNWEAHRCALGAEEARMEINVMSSDVFSSLLLPSATGQRLFAKDITVARTESVEVRRADAVLSRLIAPAEWATTHVKVDTQGFDRLVLAGFGALFANVRSLQVEVSLVALYEKGEEAEGALEFVTELLQKGFALTAFIPVARDGQQRILEADAVFRRVAL